MTIQLECMGGWSLHNRIVPTKLTIFNVSCNVCNNISGYQASLKKNTRQVKVSIYERQEHTSRTWFGGIKGLDHYREAIQLIGICPNCGAEKEIGVIPTNNTYSKEYQITGD